MDSQTISLAPLVASIAYAPQATFDNDDLNGLRSRALQHFIALGLPPRNREEWRFFDTRPIERGTFATADPYAPFDSTQLIDNVRLVEAAGATVVVRNGLVSTELSDISALEGVTLKSFSQLSQEEQRSTLDILNSHLATLFEDDPFATMNFAACEDFTILKIAKDAAPEVPLHIIYLVDNHTKASPIGDTVQRPPMTHPNLLVYAEGYAKLTLVEEWLTDATAPFVNSFTQIYLEEGATLHHVRLQRSALDALHVDRNAVFLNAHSRYDSCSYAVGAKKARTDMRIHLAAPESWARIDGVALLRGNQEIDTHSVIDNRAPHVTSHQLHKIVAAEQGHGVFNGKIFVRHGSQQIEANQLNRNLLIGPRARVDAKPQLEIFADDVICSHGSATGQLDKEQLFYLETRGISPDEARATLTSAFAAEVIETITIKSLKQRLLDEVFGLIERINDSNHVE